MPEEYVYRLVVDDSDVDKTINNINSRMQDLANRMDAAFRTVGTGAGGGMQQAAQQAEQAAQRVRQTETQTAQVVQRAHQQTAEVVTRTSTQRGQAALEAARQTAQGARESVREQRTLLDAAHQEEDAMKSKKRVAKDALNAQLAVYTRLSTEAKKSAGIQKATEKELTAAKKEGSKQTIANIQDKLAVEKEAASEAAAVSDKAKSALDAETAAYNTAANNAAKSGDKRATASRNVATATQKQRVSEGRLTTETRRYAKAEASTTRGSRTAEKQFVRQSKTYLKQRHELNQLAKRYGSFNITLGKSSGELNKHEREVYDVINSSKQLRDEVGKLTSQYGQFDVAIDRATFRGAPVLGGLTPTQVRQAGFAAQRIGVPGAAALGEAGAVAGPAGIAVAGVLLTVNELRKAFQDMAKRAVAAFTAVTKSSVEAAKEIEVARAQFEGFFEGNTGAAEAAMQRLLDLSVELGENVIGIGRAFLPEVESLDQLERVVKLATALARYQPEQGVLGARIALQEAMAGEFRSLQRRFEISPVAIDQIREAFQNTGIEGFLQALQDELERTGRSVEDLSDTFSVALGHIRERMRQIQQEMGAPIVEELKEQFAAVDEELERMEPDLVAVGHAFGEVVAKLVELVGTEIDKFLEGIDPEALLDLATAAFRVVNSIGLIFEVISPGEIAAQNFDSFVEGLTGFLDGLADSLTNVAMHLNNMREGLMRTLISMRAFFNIGQGIFKLFTLRNPLGDWGQAIELFKEAGDIDFDPIDFGEALQRSREETEEFNEELAEFIKNLYEVDSAGEAAAESIMLFGQAMEGLDKVQKDYAEVQEKVNDTINEFNIDAALKFEKILTDAKRARFDAEIGFAQKTLDIERKNAAKVNEIRTKYDEDIIDAAVALSDREADILRKHGDNLLDIEDDRNDKRLEIEEKYLEDLERLRDKFNFQAFEAMLANDAKQLRQIRRRQAFEEGQLSKDKDRNLASVDDEIEDRKEKLDRALERELRDARIANARRIRDLTASLAESLKKQEDARKEDLANQGIAEKRKRDDLNESFRRQVEDYNNWWNERLRTTLDKSQADLQLLADYAKQAQDILNKILGVDISPGIQIDPSRIEDLRQELEVLFVRGMQQISPYFTPENLEPQIQEIQLLDPDQIVKRLDTWREYFGLPGVAQTEAARSLAGQAPLPFLSSAEVTEAVGFIKEADWLELQQWIQNAAKTLGMLSPLQQEAADLVAAAEAGGVLPEGAMESYLDTINQIDITVPQQEQRLTAIIDQMRDLMGMPTRTMQEIEDVLSQAESMGIQDIMIAEARDVVRRGIAAGMSDFYFTQLSETFRQNLGLPVNQQQQGAFDLLSLLRTGGETEGVSGQLRTADIVYMQQQLVEMLVDQFAASGLQPTPEQVSTFEAGRGAAVATLTPAQLEEQLNQIRAEFDLAPFQRIDELTDIQAEALLLLQRQREREELEPFTPDQLRGELESIAVMTDEELRSFITELKTALLGITAEDMELLGQFGITQEMLFSGQLPTQVGIPYPTAAQAPISTAQGLPLALQVGGVPGVTAPFYPTPTGQPMQPVDLFGFPFMGGAAQPPFMPGIPGTMPVPSAGAIPPSPTGVEGIPAIIYPASGTFPAVPGMPAVPGAPGVPAGQFPYITGEPPQIPAQQPLEQMLWPGQFGLDPFYSPLLGFDADAFQAALDANVGAQVLAEMQKRGEIEDTVAFSALMAEKEELATAALLNNQVGDYRVASNETIAILEETLARQHEALSLLQTDPQFLEDARTVYESIGILEEILARQREEVAAQTALLAEQEAADVISAEEDKQAAIVSTVEASDRAALERKRATLEGVEGETRAVGTAAADQTGLVEDHLLAVKSARSTAGIEELELLGEHQEARGELSDDGFTEEHDALGGFFNTWFYIQEQGIERDLTQLQYWLIQRNNLIQSALDIGLPGIPGEGPDLPGGGGGGQASLSELQSLAISLADQLGMLDQDTRNEIMTLDYSDLSAFIEYLQSLLPGYALGGGYGPGLAVVGELGEEVVNMGGAGRIDVFKDLLFRSTPPVGIGGNTHNDNSTNMGGFNIPDPRGLPPTYKRIVQNMIRDAVREAYPRRRR